MRVHVSRRLLRVGPLVVARGRCTRSSPPVDGARIHLERTDERTGSVLEAFDAGGLRLRLSRGGSPGHALVPTLDVGWRGLRTPNPQRWPLTRRGRQNRRAWNARRRWLAGGHGDDGASVALAVSADAAEASAETSRWPFA